MIDGNELDQAIPNPKCFRFLDLPRELRDQIYTQLMRMQYRDPPEYPKVGGVKSDIELPTPLPSFRYPSLIWVNRQLRQEYLGIVDKLSGKGPFQAQMDIIDNGQWIEPFWSYLAPDVATDKAFDLRVNLRLFSSGHYQLRTRELHSYGLGPLKRLLDMLLSHGPDLGWGHEWVDEGDSYKIDRLSVNVTFHDVYTPATRSIASHSIFRALKALAVADSCNGGVQVIHGHSEYESNGQKQVWDREWKCGKKDRDVGSALSGF